MAAPQASSRLEMLQARFQQKQLQEKEQKLLQLYDQQQQRAYQVVQRSSAGSGGSNHGSTIRTTTTTTSTSQGGKVRQMFDERRQTVKGIDRSYPLEPLENKLRKQATNTNGMATQRNGNLTTVNRQSVNVKRVARADVNSNVNGGKPVVSYREEVTRESFGPSVYRHDDEDEFGGENRIANGHHRHDLDNEEEILDQETIDRNRMMAKIHLMGFDESLKHRVRNDLESEEFPEYLMADVPDKLPKRSITRKLSQAEARLERFKNANAKRSNNNAPKQFTTTGATAKRRAEQMLPARSSSRGSEIADGTSSGSARSGSSRAWERRNPEGAKDPSPKIRAVDRPYVADDEISKTRRESPDIATFRRGNSPRNLSRKVGTAETTWRSYSSDNYYKSLSSDGKIIMRRGASPRFRKSMDFRSTSADRGTRETRASRSTSPEFFCREGERSATTMLIDRKGSASSQEILTQQNGRIEDAATSIDRKYAEITRSQSPRSSRDKFGGSDATVNFDRKHMDFRSASADRHAPETRASRSTSPEFFRREGERSATTMTINERARRPTVSSRNREILTKQSRRITGATTSIDRKYTEITREKRFSNPPFSLRDSGKSTTISDDRTDVGLRSTSADRQTREARTSRNTSPEFFCKEGERSVTTMMIDRRGSTSSRDREILTKQSKGTEKATTSIDRKYAEITRGKRFSSPPFFLRGSGKSGATMSVDRTGVSLRSISADRQTRETRTSRSTSPQFFCKEGERSATTMMIDRRGSTSSHDREILTKQSKETEETSKNIGRKYTEIAREKRSSSPSFFLRDSGRSGATVSIDRKNIDYRSTSADRQTRETRTSRSTGPQFFCKEGERSATTMMIDRRGSTSSRDREILTQQKDKQTKRATTSIDRKYAEITRGKRFSSPSFFLRGSGKSDATASFDQAGVGLRSTSADRQTRETRTSRSTSPEFFCKEGERSATTMLINRRGSTSSRDREKLTKQIERTSKNIGRKYTEIAREKRPSSPSFFLRDSARSGATVNVDRKNINFRSTLADRQTRETRTSRSTSPEFFCKEGERSATTMMIDRRESTLPRDREILTKQSRRTGGAASTSIDRKYAEVTRDKRSSSSQFFKESERPATTTLTEPKSSSMDITKNILKPRHKYTLNTSYKQPVRPSLPNNKEARFTRVKHTPSPPMTKSEAKRSLKRDEVIVRSDSRRSSKISDISATSASSIMNLKYGLEFDNILLSTGLVRKFMKSQNKGVRKAHERSPSKRDIKNVSARTVRDGQPRNRYKVSPLFQKSRSLSTDSRERTTPEYSCKSVTPTEFDVEIQEITMTDHRMERYKSRKSSSPEQSKSRVDSPNVASSLRKIIPPKRDCGRQYGVKSKAPPRFSSLKKPARHDAGIPRTSFSRRVVDQREDQDYASKYATYTIKGRKRQNVSVARKRSPDLSDAKVNVESKSEESKDAREFSKATQREDESEEDIGRMKSLSVLPRAGREATARRFDSVAATRASPEISLRTMDVQTKAAAEELNARSTVDSSRDVTSDTILRSILQTPNGKGSRVGIVTRKGDLKTIPSKVIRSSRRITKTYRSSNENKPRSTQRQSPTCKRQLFVSDPEKKLQKGKEQTNWTFAKTRKRENYSSTNVRSRRDDATLEMKSLENLDLAKRSRSSEEAPTISVKPLRSIEDIRKSIGFHERSALTATKRSRSAIANWRSSTSRESGDTRRSISASGAARRVDQPARLTKVQSCVSRIAKSPSPDASARRQHETNARVTRGSTPSSPSKSPDVAPRRGSTESKNQDARSARRPVVAKTAESIESKTTSETMDAVDGVVQQNSSSHESSAKKFDAFVIDSDDRSKENDTMPPKKATPIKRSSNDKNQTTSSASGRPTSSNFSSAGTTQSQASSTKSKMATRAKTPVSGGSQAKGPSSARNMGNTNSADNLTACNICGRNFAQDRISLHEQICAKTLNKKRKKFDAMTFRVKGTELEPFVKKGVAKKQESHAKKPELKSNWRRKHEEFIETIRSAKMVQSHLAAGGSLKDLPPPPPSDTSDYIQCPHCGRRFNQAAAARHIPKCEHMLHNKPAHARAARPRR